MINLENQPRKKQDNPNEFSGYTASALDEGAPTEAQPTMPTDKTYTEIENQKEQAGMKPAAPEMQRYSPQPAAARLEIPAAPVYPEYPPTPSVERIRKEEVEALIEQIIEEKWEALTINIGDIGMWKEKVRTEVISIKQELLRLEHRFEQVNKAVLGKVSQYDKSIKSVGTDVKVIEKTLQKILHPLTTNIKELQRLTTKLKK